MNDPVFDLALLYVYWFVAGYMLMRGWRVLSRWLIEWNRQRFSK